MVTETPSTKAVSRSGPSCDAGISTAENTLPEGVTVYRFNPGALTAQEYGRLHPGSTSIGFWWRKATGGLARRDSRVIHVDDYRPLEIDNRELPEGCEEVLWPILEEFTARGFAEPRITRLVDPFHLLETVTIFAGHFSAETVLRISFTRNLRGLVPLQLEVALFSIFPDGSALLTQNCAPTSPSPAGQRCQVIENGEPAALWKRHSDTLQRIPHPPRAASSPEDVWDLANDLQASVSSYHLTRGIYSERSAAECDADGVNRGSSQTPNWSAASPGRFGGALAAGAWLAAILAFLAVICFATIGRKQPTAAPLSNPPKTVKAPPATEQAAVRKVQPRFVSSTAPKLRDPE
jgi:hypothetical protein